MRQVFALLLLAFAATAHAQVYKWVDANGKTQFSDQPPPGARSEVIKVKPSTGAGQPSAPGKTESLADKEAALKQRQQDQAASEAKAQAKAKREAEVAEYCNQLRGQLQGARSAGRLVKYDETGKRQSLRGDDKQAEIQRIEGELRKHCEK